MDTAVPQEEQATEILLRQVYQGLWAVYRRGLSLKQVAIEHSRQMSKLGVSHPMVCCKFMGEN